MAAGGNRLPRGTINRLTDRSVRAFVAAARAGTAPKTKLSDGGALYLTLTPAGTPTWRIKYRHLGKERSYSVGVYPSVSLDAARQAREQVRDDLRRGRDPTKARVVRRATAAQLSDATFEATARAWLEKKATEWRAVHLYKSTQALERDVLPYLGRLPIGEISTTMVANVIKRIMARGVDNTAAKILWHVRCVFQYGRATGLLTVNPADPVTAVLRKPKDPVSHAAATDLDRLREILRMPEVEHLSPSVKLANRLCAFTVARISNVVAANWIEFDLDSPRPVWSIPRNQMKKRGRKHDHRILLGPTIAAELRTWRETIGGRGYLFPSPAGKNPHIGREAVEKLYRETLGLAGEHSPHGWRSSFATLAKEAGFAKEVVDLALDHVHDSETARAYDRGDRFEQRAILSLWWDAQLTGRELEPNVIPFRAAGSGAR